MVYAKKSFIPSIATLDRGTRPSRLLHDLRAPRTILLVLGEFGWILFLEEAG
jgi:hypothetical protein